MKKFNIKQMIKEELKKAILKEAKYYTNPSCPDCEHYNAMLVSKSHDHGQAGTSTRKCRDCGFEAEYSDKEMEDVGNNTETNKKLDERLSEGTNYTSDSIREFIENNDTSSPYKPTIKFFGRDFDSKHLDVEWSLIEELIRILER